MNKSDKERKIVRKKLSFMHKKRFNTCFKRWMQFRVGAIPRLPQKTYDKDLTDLIETISGIRIYQIRTGFTIYFPISTLLQSYYQKRCWAITD